MYFTKLSLIISFCAFFFFSTQLSPLSKYLFSHGFSFCIPASQKSGTCLLNHVITSSLPHHIVDHFPTQIVLQTKNKAKIAWHEIRTVGRMVQNNPFEYFEKRSGGMRTMGPSVVMKQPDATCQHFPSFVRRSRFWGSKYTTALIVVLGDFLFCPRKQKPLFFSLKLQF